MVKFFRLIIFFALYLAPAASFATDTCKTKNDSWSVDCNTANQSVMIDVPFTKSVDMLFLEFSKSQFYLATMVTLDAYRDFYTDVPPKAAILKDRVFVSDRAFGADVKFVDTLAGSQPIAFSKCEAKSLHEVYCLNSRDSITLSDALNAGQPLTIKWIGAGGASGVAVFRSQGFREAASKLH